MKPLARSGFSLVELLVAVGILGLLIAILVPSLNSARQTAKRVECLANLRTLSQAFVSYLVDSKNTFPQPSTDSHLRVANNPPPATANAASERLQAASLWFNALDPYLTRLTKNYGTDAKQRNYKSFKQDPVYATFNEDTETNGGAGSRTFKMNQYFGEPGPGVKWTKIAALYRAAETVLVFDGVAQDCGVVPFDANGLIASGVATDFHGDEQAVGLRHNGAKSANVLFADFHAATVTQPTRRYESTSGKTRYATWHFEFQGDTEAARALSTAPREPKQTLLWDFRRR